MSSSASSTAIDNVRDVHRRLRLDASRDHPIPRRGRVSRAAQVFRAGGTRAVIRVASRKVRRFVRSRRRGADDGGQVWYDAVDADDNVAWNRERWGDEDSWRRLDLLGYRWSGGVLTTPATMAKLADTYLRPYLGDRYDLAILEISAGGGRMTAELVRHASRMSLVDLNAAAIKVCRERFARLPTPIEFVVNDGLSLAGVKGTDFDFIACFDSMVHMHPDVIRGYVAQMPALMSDQATAWLDHSGRGQRDEGSCTAMTAELMAEFASEAGLELVEQLWRNDWDCISVLRKT